MNLSTTVTVSTTKDVKLEPALRLKLQKRLRVYAGLKVKYEDAKKALDREKANLGGYREQTGEQSVSLDGYGTITEVRGVTSKLDKKKFVALGGSLTMLEEATVVSPKRPYELITLPGASDDDD